ncbi:MAG TPA: nitrile hydratase accessory protein [Dongiaceae bacterium]|nr:nitrile hydratase accessory protein [Dongiaceae bacterium]
MSAPERLNDDDTGAVARSLLQALPAIPQDESGPVFAEPWQAQAFAMTIALYERGLFTWPEWAAALSHAIKTAQLAGDRDLGDTYYQHWLTALEALIVEKGISSTAALHDCAEAWDRAARATPHGRPIDLGNDPLQDRR